MDQTAVRTWTEESSDTDLLASVRAGDFDAYRLLFERHAGAARRVAFAYTSVQSDVDDIVSESFERVFRALLGGSGPERAFRAYLFTIVRRTALLQTRRVERVAPAGLDFRDDAAGTSPPSGDSVVEGFENGAVSEAFRSLPERWQTVLWYTTIEKMTPAEVAPRLGLSPNGAAALAYRAREALRQAYLQQHLAKVHQADCLTIFDSLGGYVRGGLQKREHSRVERHLASCDHCESLVRELEDVNGLLR